MTWVKISDDLWRHPKVVDLMDDPDGPAGLCLWTLAQSWIGETLTDGLIPARQPMRLLGSDPSAAIGALVRARLWEPAPGGWRVHDFLQYNPSRAQVIALRKARAEAGQKGGRANLASADREGRRDEDGQFTEKHLLGELNGELPGDSPSNAPSKSPTPSPVSRIPVSRTPITTSPPPPSPSAGRGRRKDAENPRQVGASPRQNGHSPRDRGASPRQELAAEKRSSPQLAGSVLAEMAKGLGR